MSFLDGRKPNFVDSGSGRVNRSGVHQHDRDVVLNGVHTAAFAAFQTFPVRLQDHRLLANRADQHLKQILRNHSGSIVPRSESGAEPISLGRGLTPSSAQGERSSAVCSGRYTNYKTALLTIRPDYDAI